MLLIFKNLEIFLLQIWETSSNSTLFIGLLFGFSMLYFGMTFFFQLVGSFLCRKGIATKQISQDLFPGQLNFEIKHSLLSIVVFSIYGFLIFQLNQADLLSFVKKDTVGIFIDLGLLALWNEFHFYVCHRLMHSKFLIRFHSVHHRSLVVTPFSTYSFHPIESVLNGSVLLLFMLVYPISIVSFFLFPIYHLFFNTLGHTNLRLVKNSGLFKKTFISGHHMLHHKKGRVNFAFVTHFLDRIFKSYSN